MFPHGDDTLYYEQCPLMYLVFRAPLAKKQPTSSPLSLSFHDVSLRECVCARNGDTTTVRWWYPLPFQEKRRGDG